MRWARERGAALEKPVLALVAQQLDLDDEIVPEVTETLEWLLYEEGCMPCEDFLGELVSHGDVALSESLLSRLPPGLELPWTPEAADRVAFAKDP
eukprot:5061487-Prymnesium_polylepis.1